MTDEQRTPTPAFAEQLVELAQTLRDQAIALDGQRQAPAPRPAQEAAERRTPATPSTSTHPSTKTSDGSAGKAEAARRFGTPRKS